MTIIQKLMTLFRGVSEAGGSIPLTQTVIIGVAVAIMEAAAIILALAEEVEKNL